MRILKATIAIALLTVMFMAPLSVYGITNTKSVDLENYSSVNKQVLDHADNASLSVTGDITLACWFNLETLPSAAGPGALISKWNHNAGSERSYFLAVKDTAGNVVAESDYRADGFTNNVVLAVDVSATVDATGEWHHLAAVADVSASDITIYLNASDVGGTPVGTATSIHDNASAFAIGSLGGPSGSDLNYFDGQLDDCGVWSRILTSAEIDDLFNQDDTYCDLTSTDADLIGFWRMEDNGTDESSNNNDLTETNSPTYNASVPFASHICGAPAVEDESYIIELLSYKPEALVA